MEEDQTVNLRDSTARGSEYVSPKLKPQSTTGDDGVVVYLHPQMHAQNVANHPLLPDAASDVAKERLESSPVQINVQHDEFSDAVQQKASVNAQGTQKAAPAGVDAIYASGDKAKINAWENFVKQKEAEKSGGNIVSDDKSSDIHQSIVSDKDHKASRISDKSMTVQTEVKINQPVSVGGMNQQSSSSGLKELQI